MLLWLILAGLGIAAAGGRKAGRATVKRMGLSVKKITDDPYPSNTPECQYVGPPTKIDAANGYTPYWVKSAAGKRLEWGACFYRWHQDLRKRLSEEKAMQRFINVMGKLVDWGMGLKPAIKWLIDRLLCFRVGVGAVEVKLENGPTLWGPEMPRGLPSGTTVCGDVTILNGWNPTSTRVGFAAKFGEWPLGWPPPEGMLTGAWLKNLGDHFGVGHDVYQMISANFGEDRSFPMMSRAGWRAVIRLGRDEPFPHGNVLDMFDTWRAHGTEKIKRVWSTKKKAEKVYT